jgi:hypothetical protein
MSKQLFIGMGVAAAAAVAYFMYTKNQQGKVNAAAIAPGGATTTTSLPAAMPTPTVKQTMWKDKDGNVFQLTSDLQKWGYVIKVNGSVHKKWNQMMAMFLGTDGYVRGVDNNGSAFIWKNNQWNYVIKDNKVQAGQFLNDNGQPNVYNQLKGLGNAFYLN